MAIDPICMSRMRRLIHAATTTTQRRMFLALNSRLSTPRRLSTGPMHLEIEQTEPGTCPKCSMDLEPKFLNAEDEDDSELGNGALKTSVADVVTREVITLKPQDYLSDAAELMYENRIHRVFVVNDNKWVGVLSPFDSVRLYARNRLIAGHSTLVLDF